jgi:hypothetical protein
MSLRHPEAYRMAFSVDTGMQSILVHDSMHFVLPEAHMDKLRYRKFILLYPTMKIEVISKRSS